MKIKLNHDGALIEAPIMGEMFTQSSKYNCKEILTKTCIKIYLWKRFLPTRNQSRVGFSLARFSLFFDPLASLNLAEAS